MTAILQLPADAYHADQVGDQPTLSASIAYRLCTQTPKHAWTNHPRLNPDFVREEEQKFDLGNAVHALFLEGLDKARVVEAKDWRTKSAQEERDEARANNLIPLLRHQYDQALEMVDAINNQLSHHEAFIYTGGYFEQTLVWEEDGVTCRARLDWLSSDHTRIADLKTTSRSAHPAAYARTLFNVGGEIQTAMYLRGLAAVTGATRWADFYWAVVETTPPYALSVIAPAPDMLELGQRKVEFAIGLWRECMESGSWPAYSTRVAYANAPEYEISRWLEREEIAA